MKSERVLRMVQGKLDQGTVGMPIGIEAYDVELHDGNHGIEASVKHDDGRTVITGTQWQFWIVEGNEYVLVNLTRGTDDVEDIRLIDGADALADAIVADIMGAV